MRRTRAALHAGSKMARSCGRLSSSCARARPRWSYAMRLALCTVLLIGCGANGLPAAPDLTVAALDLSTAQVDLSTAQVDLSTAQDLALSVTPSLIGRFVAGARRRGARGVALDWRVFLAGAGQVPAQWRGV